jgi:DNA-binding NarL/FixJ family response regulator
VRLVTVRILLVDDHALFVAGMKRLFSRARQTEIVGIASDGQSAVQLARDLGPAVALVDMVLPDLSGLDVTRLMLAAAPTTRIVGLSAFPDERLVKGMLESGAAGYLLKWCHFDEVLTAVRTVAAGGVYVTPAVAAGSGPLPPSSPPGSGPAASTGEMAPTILTTRERQVLQALAEGKSIKETGQVLDTSIKTVEFHRRNIMKKLDVHTIAGLTKLAVLMGLTTLK